METMVYYKKSSESTEEYIGLTGVTTKKWMLCQTQSQDENAYINNVEPLGYDPYSGGLPFQS
jgi:hypothetical protein